MDASIHMHIHKTPKSSISNLTGEHCVIEDAFPAPFVSDERSYQSTNKYLWDWFALNNECLGKTVWTLDI
jgi:hypothetical protein